MSSLGSLVILMYLVKILMIPPDETEVEYDGRKRMKFIYYMK